MSWSCGVPQGVFGWWIGGWFGDEEIAVLTLPESLRDARLDADLNLDAGASTWSATSECSM